MNMICYTKLRFVFKIGENLAQADLDSTGWDFYNVIKNHKLNEKPLVSSISENIHKVGIYTLKLRSVGTLYWWIPKQVLAEAAAKRNTSTIQLCDHY